MGKKVTQARGKDAHGLEKRTNFTKEEKTQTA